jgi:hypothetical protein
MNQQYYRDLRKRVEALEDVFLPEPEPRVIVYWCGEDGLPEKVIVVGHGRWTRRENEPIPPAVLRFAQPEALRAAREAQPANPPAAPPPRSTGTGD